MKKWIFRTIGSLVALYFVAGIFLIPYLIRMKAPEIAHELTGGTLVIKGAAFNPLIFTLTLNGIRFETPEGEPLLTLKQLDVNLDVIHLFRGVLSVERIGLDTPRLYLERQKDGKFNFDWLTRLGDKNATKKTETAEANGTLPSIVIESFELDNGGVEYSDLSLPQPLHLHVKPIGLTMTDIRTAGKGANHIHFYAHTDSGGLIDIKSTIRSFAPFAIDGTVNYDAGQLYLAYQYLQNFSGLEVAQGRIHAGLSFAVDTSKMNDTEVSDINLTVSKLRIIPKKEEGKDALRVRKIAVDAGPVYPLRGEATVSSVVIDHPYVLARRLADGSIDWQHYFPAPAAAAKPAQAPADANKTGQSGPAMQAVIKKIAVIGGKLRFEDHTLRRTAVETVDDLNVTLAPVSTDKTKPVDFAAQFGVNGHGSVDVNGFAVAEPLHADAQLNVKGFVLAPFSPYVENSTFAKITGGSIEMNSRIAYAPSKTKADLSARGNFHLRDLLVDDTRDKMPLVSAGSLKAKDYLVELMPNRLFVDTVNLGGFYANVDIDQNQTLNLASVVRPSAPKPKASKPKAAAGNASDAFPVRIVRAVIKNSAVHFADHSLPLPFDTQIHDVHGQVLGISTLSKETTYVSMDGEIDRYGVAKAEGSLNSADPKAFTDMNVAFRNIDMHSLTPYSGKFVGRAIDSGKMTVTLRYHILKGQMKGDNGLVINKIELGKDVESKDAVSLPLDFAIALLEDRDGVIDIDMPVKGDVNNPEFAWGGVVWNAFVNLLTKAVTAPFDLIGSMLGIEGDELKTVPFEPGSYVVDAASRERLDQLSTALDKRPKLGITVQGTYDNVRDTAALKRAALVREVLATSGKESVKAQEALVPALLEPIYAKRKGEEALDALKAQIASLDTDDTEKARQYTERLITELTASQPLPANALAHLAQAREEAIRTYLVSGRGIDGVRIKSAAPAAVKSEDDAVATQITLDVAK